jgi:8-oxo-dGTP pyrophosphatase MutT (NUDIX family)
MPGDLDPVFPVSEWLGWDLSFSTGFPDAPDGDFPEAFAVLVFAFQDQSMLVADIEDRGLTVPSGRLEPGETTHEAARRELMEEAGAECGELIPLGQFTMTNAEKSRRSVAFIATSVEIVGEPTHESRGATWLPLAELATQYAVWNPTTEAVIHYAFGISQLHLAR